MTPLNKSVKAKKKNFWQMLGIKFWANFLTSLMNCPYVSGVNCEYLRFPFLPKIVEFSDIWQLTIIQ